MTGLPTWSTQRLKPLADDAGFRDRCLRAKQELRIALAMAQSSSGQIVDPKSIFDCQVKRIHEYKRQLLNALRIVVLYNRLRENPGRCYRRERSSLPAKRPGLPPGEADHQADQQLGGDDRCRSGVRGRLKSSSCPTTASRLPSG